MAKMSKQSKQWLREMAGLLPQEGQGEDFSSETDDVVGEDNGSGKIDEFLAQLPEDDSEHLVSIISDLLHVLSEEQLDEFIRQYDLEDDSSDL